ncbi:hypothetical protein GCM10023086_03680 [Streptomyces venetus]|uniref:Uncharacterized protein n=1 Tax=Streptomyces venetus TaxID=1701086 RepID=A0ABP8F2K6_9ACTN
MVAAAEEERDEDRFRVPEGGERVGEQRGVEFDVPQVHRQAGAQRADPVEEGADRAQRAWVAAAVRHDDEGGRRRATWGGRRDEAELAGHGSMVAAPRCLPVAWGSRVFSGCSPCGTGSV